MAAADVVVVGASVAGCATALGLADRGLSVLLLDRAEFPREKACGEGLMPHGVERLAALGIAVPGRRFDGIRYAVGEVSATGCFPEGRGGLGVRRRDLDAALLSACSRRPEIQVRTGTRVRGISGVPGSMRVQLDDEEVSGRALVGADGMRSKVRGWLGLEGVVRGRQRFGARQHFRLAGGQSSGRFVEVHVLPDLGVEIYLTPTAPDELNLALLLEKREMGRLRGDLEGGIRALIDRCPALRERMRGAVPISEPLAIGPLRQSVRAGVADGAILVGDAAGFLDGITGEGMSLALISAAIAAEVLADGIASDRLGAADLAHYDAIRRERSRDLTALTEVILWGIRHRWLARRVVRNLGRHPALFERILAVNTGRSPLRSIGLGGVRTLLVGR